MASIEIKIGDLSLDNPIMLASATPTWDGERSDRGFAKGAGASVLKTICYGEDHYIHPQNGRFIVFKSGGKPFGMVNVEIFSTYPESIWLNKELKRAKENGAKIIASTLAEEDPTTTAQLIKDVERTGLVDAFELNNSCPMHVNLNDFNIVPITIEQTYAARKATKLPLMVKFPSTVTSLVDPLKAAESCGADGVVISNSMRGFAGVDIFTATPNLGTIGGYSGKAIKPLIQAMIIDAAGAVNIPIIAVGGVNDWQDIIEYIMLGATGVQIASAVMWNGYDYVGEMAKKISGFLDDQKYESIQDIRGIALPKIGDYNSILNKPPKTAFINADSCVKCGKCLKTCFYDALIKTKDKIIVDQIKCDGCGLCEQLCPVNAVRLKEK